MSVKVVWTVGAQCTQTYDLENKNVRIMKLLKFLDAATRELRGAVETRGCRRSIQAGKCKWNSVLRDAGGRRERECLLNSIFACYVCNENSRAFMFHCVASQPED
jgi:hypothetical protein